MVDLGMTFDPQFTFHNHINTVADVSFRNTFSCDATVKVAAVFLEYNRAFETIDRRRLIDKLSKLILGGKVLSWFECYLINRRQNVKINERVSKRLFHLEYHRDLN
ncbi:uncharacterized protein LOC143909166 [Arctopsyche grandis]|uniref:uncharacterized protein LOC143909166 n=1 Tax=Arctopsyche grandis TaxID=121162 RepID=UPI00406D923E